MAIKHDPNWVNTAPKHQAKDYIAIYLLGKLNNWMPAYTSNQQRLASLHHAPLNVTGFQRFAEVQKWDTIEDFSVGHPIHKLVADYKAKQNATNPKLEV